MKNKNIKISNNDLEQLIALAKIVAKPWVIATTVLSMLLGMSMGVNVYISTQKVDVVIENDADFIHSDNNTNIVEK